MEESKGAKSTTGSLSKKAFSLRITDIAISHFKQQFTGDMFPNVITCSNQIILEEQTMTNE